MARRLSFASLVVALTVALAVEIVPAANSGASRQNSSLCSLSEGTYSSSAPRGILRYTYTNQSYWESPQDYWAYRRRDDGTFAYSHLQDVSAWGAGHWGPNPANSIDVWRRTESDGTLGASWHMEQWAGTAC